MIEPNIIKGKDWEIKIFPSGSQFWRIDSEDPDRINECIKEMNDAEMSIHG